MEGPDPLTEVGAEYSRGGFWVRSAAAALDLLFLYVFLRVLEAVLVHAGVYFPFEAAFLVLAAVYFAGSVAWGGTTPGKWLCGLKIIDQAGKRVGILRALVQEIPGKILSAVPLFAGFIAVAGREKRGWHDRIAGTVVVRQRRNRRTRLTAAIGLGTAALIVGIWITGTILMTADALSVLPSSPGEPRYIGRDAESLVEVSTIENTKQYVSWLHENAMTAEEFVLEKCRSYDVVIFGEIHEQKVPLAFLCEILPRLYHEAGVRCIAMEWLLAEDNDTIERLVTADGYDDDLAVELARHQSWGVWGFKSYVDVLHAAWDLNRKLPASAEKMGIVGLDIPIDIPSIALCGISDAPLDAPLWERLRIFRVVREIPKFLLRDVFMARQVEREALEKGKRTVVWVGSSHSTIFCRNPGPDVGGWGGMGYILHGKYPDRVTQILIHAALFSESDGRSEPKISGFLEDVIRERGGDPVGFEVTGSPFDPLRDSENFAFRYVPEMSLSDLASGYLFLGPVESLGKSEWIPGFITPEMFARNRPLYVGFGKRENVDVRSAADANRLFAGGNP